MRNLIASAAVVLTAWSTVSQAQTASTVAQPAPTPQSAAVADMPPASNDLSDLNAMTFACPKAALNAAAREAAKIRSQGTYQFSYFKIASDSHHSFYEVYFRSNYSGEQDLKYCVALYCQQGWDPKTTKASVTLMSDARKSSATAAHGAHCGAHPKTEKRQSKQSK